MKSLNFTKLSHEVIGSAIEVHKMPGPGLLESAYQQCLAHELKLRGISFQLEYPLSVEYKDVYLDCGYRIDLYETGRGQAGIPDQFQCKIIETRPEKLCFMIVITMQSMKTMKKVLGPNSSCASCSSWWKICVV